MMTKYEFKECCDLLNAWYEDTEFASQAAYSRAIWAIKKIATDFSFNLSEEGELMLYTIVVRRGPTYKEHDHFFTVSELFEGLDDIIENSAKDFQHVTFSKNGLDKPISHHEIIVTIYKHVYNGTVGILCPVSAGGKWAAYDDYRDSKKIGRAFTYSEYNK